MKKHYGGLQSEQVQELKQLTEENARLKKLVADFSLDKSALQDVLSKKIPRPALMKSVVDYVTAYHGYSERKACALTRQHRSTQRKPMVRDPRTAVRQRMHEIVRTRIRYGYRRVHIMLRREGWGVGRNLVYRLYREVGLVLRTKRPRRRKMVVHREARIQPKRPNEAWSLDFIHDELSNGQKFRALTVVDIFTREGLAIEVGHRLKGENVVEVLNKLVRLRGAPKYLFADNGAEFTGQLVALWAYHHGTRIDFSRPGKPTDNAFIETFNGTLRDECLNIHWFGSIVEAKRLIEAWRIDYNESRPHMALGNKTPSEYRSNIIPLPQAEGLKPAEN